MTPDSTASWLELFSAGPDEPKTTVRLRVLHRSGKPFLYVPTHNRAAARALDLYPAQTWKARLAKACWQTGFQLNPRQRGGGEPFLLPPQNIFLTSLARTAGLPAGKIPEFAVLAGNPNAPGRRFIFLLFDAEANPVAVVKAGGSERARELIQHEAALLREFGGKLLAVPRLRDASECGNVTTFSTDFIAGDSPVGDTPEPLEAILSAWLDETRTVTLGELPAWQRLVQTQPDAMQLEVVRALAQLPVPPALMHGDLAPWNVKVAEDRWTVLDWERGERLGVPGWDWLHFVLQPAILVRRATATQLIATLERLFTSEHFARYAQRAKVRGQEWPLAMAYVSYCLQVTRQTEGVEQLTALLQALQARLALKK